ncbi:MAG: hypothetical protein IH598_15370 [Bacteroidales bacterium]|nr:hypothetical protein [Bacteroidales bacterium]
MKQLIMLVLILGLITDTKSQNIEFFSENLTFRLQKGLFEVDGIYFFRNETGSDVKKALFYPFPDTETYGPVSFLSIKKEGDTVSMLINQTDKGALFLASLQSNEEVAYHIIYRQKLNSKKATYIITTTQKWGKPFKTADYRLEFPDSLKFTSISIEPDSIFIKNDLNIYIWHRQNFMPTVDFEFEFE